MKSKNSLELKIKSDKELSTLTDKNLLAYYKAEKIRFFKFEGSHKCDCCGMLSWDLHSCFEKTLKVKYDEWKSYIWKLSLLISQRPNLINQYNEKHKSIS